MLLDRELLKVLKTRSTQYPVIALVGPRQSGKTTLARSAFPDREYVSLEDFDNREFAEEDPRGFIRNYPDGAILDEIQRVPKLLSYLQTEVDSTRQTGKFILTGSNQFLLMKGISQSLAGRISINRLLPFSLGELNNTSWFPGAIDEFLFKGGYPRIYDMDLDSSDWLSNYITTYFEKDLKDFINVSDLNAFRKMLILLASSCGQLLNLSSIGNSIGVSHNTVKSWIAALEASYLIFLLQPYHRNYSKRIVKSPKVYFYDTGLAAALLKIGSKDQLSNHYIKGAFFENWVITEYIKSRYNRGEQPDSYFWRDHAGNEIDLIFEESTGTYPVEVKSGQTINSDFFKGLKHFSSVSSIDHSILVYGGEQEQYRTDCTVIPWRQWPVFLSRL